MHKAMTLAMMLLIVGVVCGGCMSSPAGIESSTKPLNPGGYTELGAVKGNAVGVIVFGFPVSEPYPARIAVDRAISKGGGDALVNVTTDVTQILLGPVTIVWTTVNGTAVSSTQ